MSGTGSRPMRIIVVGAGGAGKSTLSRSLGSRLGIPVIHMDAEFWQPGWRQPSREQWRRRVDDLVAGDAWIIDGAHRDSLERSLEKADLLVLLDPSPLLLLWRVVRRWLGRRRRPDLGLRERLTASFVLQTLTYRARIAPLVIAAARRRRVPLVVLRHAHPGGGVEGAVLKALGPRT